MWLLILIAVNMNNSKDQPGRVELTFQDQKTCEQVLSTMRYDLKFKSFKVEGECKKQG
jgi:hypothetical protein